MAIDHEEYKISKMLRNLGVILRYSINKSNSIVSVVDLADWLDKYISLHQMRFEGVFDYQIIVDEKAWDKRLHKLLIQPFIENAILHGFKEMEQGGWLRVDISASEAGDMLHIIIEDNGNGIPAEILEQYNQVEQAIRDEGKSIGMHNAFARINMYYGAKASWNISSLWAGQISLQS